MRGRVNGTKSESLLGDVDEVPAEAASMPGRRLKRRGITRVAVTLLKPSRELGIVCCTTWLEPLSVR
jgi:hypothetical protein